MNWKGKWIWFQGEPSPRNFWLAVRKVFELTDEPKDAKLYITADSRYVVWLNNRRLGQGPIRSWPWNWSYDTYDVKGSLRKGKNAVCVLVLHYGISNFQYIKSRGGLLAQMETVTMNGKKTFIGTDKTWKGIIHPSYDRRTPRISCHQGWVEHYDARNEPEGWLSPDFKDSTWQNLSEIGHAGIAPWRRLSEREIPFLTEEPVYPVRILRNRIVKPLYQHFGFDLRPNLLPEDKTTNPVSLSGFAVSVLRSPTESKGRIIYPDQGLPGKIRINGKDCPWRGGNSFDQAGIYAECKFKKGDNMIVWDMRGITHNWHLMFSIDAPFIASHRAPCSTKKTKAKVATLSIADAKNNKIYDQIWNAHKEEDIAPYRNLLREVSIADEISENVFAKTILVKESAQKPRICSAEMFCIANSDTTTVFAPKQGDVEILIDFGKEIVGFLEFEVEAESGVILDFNCFESIQEERLDFTWGLHNVFRYVTREGRQFYHSVVRRGFRYVLLVIRFPEHSKGPLKIEFLRCLLNTYPVVERGVFVCNDPLLNQIWRMGAYTTRLCSEDVFVDCPSYEQTFWVGDSRNEAAVNYVAFGEYRLPRRCLLLAADSLKCSPLVESQVPSGWRNIIPAWSLLWVIACEEFYQITVDVKFLKKVYPAVAKQNRNIEKFVKNGLLSINAWNMLDWAGMDTPDDAFAVTHQNAWYVESLRRSAKLAEVLGKRNDADKWLGTAERVKRAINKNLWDEDKKAYVDCIRKDRTRSPVVSQQTNTVVFLCDCAARSRAEIIKKYISNPPRDFVKAGSPFMMFFVFEALARLGNFEMILNLIRKKWGLMIEKGATTCWEMFPGLFEDGRWTRSHCHAWSAAPTYFLSVYQLGVNSEEAGFRKVNIAPQPAGLMWAQGTVPTPHGMVKMTWTNKKGRFMMEFCLPNGIPGRIVLPDFVHSDAKLEICGGFGKDKMFTGKNWQIEADAGADGRITARY